MREKIDKLTATLSDTPPKSVQSRDDLRRSSSYLTIDLHRVLMNLQTLKQRYGEVMPLVKGNAYGTDIIQLGRFFERCEVPMLGVSHVNEGIQLREHGIQLPIFVICAPPFEADQIVKYRLTPAVSSFEEVNALANFAKEAYPVHLNINTGMNRLGVRPEQALALVDYIQNHPKVELEGVMTHFAAATKQEHDSFTQDQIKIFHDIVQQINPPPKWIHAACSASHYFELPFCNLARIGLALFGFAPNLQLALSLESHLTAITTCKKGESIGYDRAYKVEKEEMRVGVIPMGYHDGLHRHYFGKGYLLIHGKKAPLIGKICMDFTMVDLREIPEAKVGDSVTIFGPDLHPETFARWGETDVRELLSCLSPRVKRVFISLRRQHDTERVSSATCSIEKHQNPGSDLLSTRLGS